MDFAIPGQSKFILYPFSCFDATIAGFTECYRRKKLSAHSSFDATITGFAKCYLQKKLSAHASFDATIAGFTECYRRKKLKRMLLLTQPLLCLRSVMDEVNAERAAFGGFFPDCSTNTIDVRCRCATRNNAQTGTSAFCSLQAKIDWRKPI